MALLAWGAIGIVLARRGGLGARGFWLASALVIAAPIAWLIYNAAAFGDWLFFLRGPYSAKAIEIRTSVPGFPPHPGWHNPWVALVFFAKAAELDAAAKAWGNVLLVLSLLGTAWAWVAARRRALGWALLLWFPMGFYAYSVAYGSVPIFLPVWWPHSFYNTRYGLELLPALALFAGFALEWLLRKVRNGLPQYAWAIAAVLIVAAAANAWWVGRNDPLVFAEARGNDVARGVYEEQIATRLKMLHE